MPWGRDVGPSFMVIPYILYHMKHEYPLNISFIGENETMVFEIRATFENYRSFKPQKLDFFMTNMSYQTIFQHEILEFVNTDPQHLINLTVTPNSYYTSDRAIYAINYITYMNGSYVGDIFEFKTSKWK